jgi:cytochrome P450
MRAPAPTGPLDPIAAVSHADPYPYYADLVAHRPFSRDGTLGLWVASGAAAVTAVLTSAACRVRPPAEPVPPALAGSSAGAIFGHLVRMNDGARHDALKAAVTATLDALARPRVEDAARRWAPILVRAAAPHEHPERLSELASSLTAHVVASLLGAPPDVVPDAARWTADFVGALAPGADAAQLERGTAAAGHLLALGHAVVSSGTGGLLPALARHAAGQDLEAIVANALGFLSQAHDATTGLIGNALVTLARRPGIRAAVLADRDRLSAVVGEVARHDAPVQNTRRFVAEDTAIAGVRIPAGETILVVLAAANRDPAANTEPDRFDPARPAPRTFTFGVGPHACPGAAFATTLAAAAIDTLLTSGLRLEGLADGVTYRPAPNVRIPIFRAKASLRG